MFEFYVLCKFWLLLWVVSESFIYDYDVLFVGLGGYCGVGCVCIQVRYGLWALRVRVSILIGSN